MAAGASAAPGKGTSVWTGRRGSQVRVTMGMWTEFASWVKSLCVCVCVCVCVAYPDFSAPFLCSLESCLQIL